MTKRSRTKKGQEPTAAPPSAGAADPTGQTPPVPSAKCPAAVFLGRKGGLKGGPARARKLTPKQRSAIARKAALARWAERRPS
jgi:hypothetical protein